MTEDVVSVSAPARLHLGFLDPGGRSGRRFGGIGLALEAPATRLSLERSADDRATGPDAERALRHLHALRAHLKIASRHSLRIDAAIPAHAGLGSGTQLALAVARSLRALEGLGADLADDMILLGRGRRSGLGTAFFEEGGVAVDGGHGPGALPAPIVSRLPFPDAWRVILVLDKSAEGVHGAEEIAAFETLPSFPEAQSAEICRLVLMQLLPGLAENDVAAFGAAVARVQSMVGEHFAPVQGGIFANRRVAKACEALAAEGAHGIGQSSWGPTGFAFADTAEEAERLVAKLGPAAADLDIRIVWGRNRGATISRTSLHRLAEAR